MDERLALAHARFAEPASIRTRPWPSTSLDSSVTRCTTLSRRSTAYQAMLPSFLHASVALAPGHRRLLIFMLGLVSHSCCLILNNLEKNYCQAATRGYRADPSLARKSRSDRQAPRVSDMPGGQLYRPLGLSQFFSKGFNIRPQSRLNQPKLIASGE